jgi:hypothetical protein
VVSHQLVFHHEAHEDHEGKQANSTLFVVFVVFVCFVVNIITMPPRIFPVPLIFMNPEN